MSQGHALVCLLQAGEIVDDDLNRVLINPLPTVSEGWLLAGPAVEAITCRWLLPRGAHGLPPSRCKPQLPPTSGCLGCCRV